MLDQDVVKSLASDILAMLLNHRLAVPYTCYVIISDSLEVVKNGKVQFYKTPTFTVIDCCLCVKHMLYYCI